MGYKDYLLGSSAELARNGRLGLAAYAQLARIFRAA